MDIRKPLQASAFNFISPKLVGKAVLQFMLIMLHYINSALRNKQQITSYLKKNNGNTKKLIFSFNIINSVKKSVLHFLITDASLRIAAQKTLFIKHFEQNHKNTNCIAFFSFIILQIVTKGILGFDFATATHWHMYEIGNWQLLSKKTLKADHENTKSMSHCANLVFLFITFTGLSKKLIDFFNIVHARVNT